LGGPSRAVSAYSGKRRPGFEALLAAVKNGELDALICWHPDRLYRSMRDLERLIEVADVARVKLKTVQGGDLDLSTSAGRMVGRILGATARQESEHTAERRRLANAQRRAAGKWRLDGPRSFGYSKTGEPLEPEASALRQAVTDVLAGASLRSIAIDWNGRGLTTTRGGTWANPQLRRTLANPLNAGLVCYEGRVVGSGEWEPLIDKDTHLGLAAFLNDPARKPGSAFLRTHLLSGVARCGVCDAPLYAVYPHKGSGDPRHTYSCRASGGAHVGRLGPLLDEYLEGFVLGLFSRPKDRKRLAALLNGGRNVDVKALQARRDALQARMDELARMFTAGDIDSSQLRSGTAEYKAQLADIDKALGAKALRSPAAGMLAADDPRAYWHECSADIRGKIITDVMTVTVLPAPRGRWFKDRELPTSSEWERFAKYLDIKPKAQP
jgi:site-specific DNA recombinase